MKKTLNIISIAGFFIIVVMLGGFTVFRARGDLGRIFSSGADAKQTASDLAQGYFPLDTNWRSLHTMITRATTGSEINGIYSDDERLMRVYPDYDKGRAFSNSSSSGRS